ncbi:MAG: hypothetical protein HQL06_16795 [Nitrospirae bacterium]|nr:hypothetical protein [Nitrospirota bacterium]
MVPKCADFIEIREAYDIANEITWSEKELEIYEYWQIRFQDERGAIEYAAENALIKGQIEGERKGIIKGRVEGKLEGLLEGIEGMLEIKYGPAGLEIMASVKELMSIERLEEFKELLKTSKTIDELRALL